MRETVAVTDAGGSPHHQTDTPGTAGTPGPLADASVRTGRPNDTPAIGAVQAETFAASYADILPAQALDQFHPDVFARVWRDSISAPPTPSHRVLVACAGDQVVGFAAIGPGEQAGEDVGDDSSGRAGEVFLICVHSAARRTGHGSRLLNASADTLTAAGFASMSCWVLAQDEDSRAFATAAGLVPDGAFRERVVSPEGETVREVRLVASLGT